MKFFFFSLLSLCIAVPTSAFAGGSASADTSHIRTSGDTTFFINAEGKIHQLMIQRPNDQKMFNDFSLQSQLTVFDWASLSMGFSSPYFLNFLALRAEMVLGYLPIHVENQTERELGYSSGGGIAIRAKLKQWTTETYSAKGMKTSMARLYVDNGLLFTSQESKGIANFNVVLKHELGVEFGFAGQSTVSFFLGYM